MLFKLEQDGWSMHIFARRWAMWSPVWRVRPGKTMVLQTLVFSNILECILFKVLDTFCGFSS